MKINIKPCKISTSFKNEKIYPELEKLTVVPSKEEQNFEGAYGKVNVKGVTAEIDENIKSENIKQGVNILGVDGGYKSVDTSDATAISSDIAEGKTAYVKGEKVIGTMKTGVVVSAIEPEGNDRKSFWYQKNIKNLIDKPFTVGDWHSKTNSTRLYYYGNTTIKKGVTYTFNTNLPDEFKIALAVSTNKVPHDDLSYFFVDTGWLDKSNLPYTFTPSKDGYFAAAIKKRNDDWFFTEADYERDTISEINNYLFQLEEGSKATEYEGGIEPKLYMLNDNNEYEEFI